MYPFLKSLFDKILSLILILFLSPIFLIIIFILKYNYKTIFFIQKRPGLNAKIFNLMKFQTMTPLKNNEEIDPSKDKERLTKFGKFLRNSSLDEIPQLINVLKGDLSLVGPRPLLVEYLPLYNERQKQRHKVKPGITGWAQVNGRNSISWEEKFELDLWYVENCSFILDLKILAMTFFKVLKRDDVNTSVNITMEKFKGSK